MSPIPTRTVDMILSISVSMSIMALPQSLRGIEEPASPGAMCATSHGEHVRASVMARKIASTALSVIALLFLFGVVAALW